MSWPARSSPSPPTRAGADRLAACKAFLKEAMAALRARHDAGASGLEIERGRAAIIDAMVARLFDHAIALFARTQGPHARRRWR